MYTHPYIKSQLVFTGVSGFTGVLAGAVGAHALKGKVPEERQSIFRDAANYQIMHSGALAAIIGMKIALHGATLKNKGAAVKCLDTAFFLIAAGIAGFSGQIYSNVLGGPKALSPITPLGGLSLMAGWAALVVTALFL